MAAKITEAAVLDALKETPHGERVSGVIIKDGNVGFTFEVADAADAEAAAPIIKALEKTIRALPGVLSATAMVTAHRPSKPEDRAAASKAPQGQASASAHKYKSPDARPKHHPARHVIAVASGKGGVGKSTTAINLALALKVAGNSGSGNGGGGGSERSEREPQFKVALLDADIYGPSVPRLVGGGSKPQTADGRIIPIEAHGIKAMSIGFVTGEETPTIWRGPMVMSAIEQMLRDVDWGAPDMMPDIMIVDMPPGTGDAQLTLAQRCVLAGAVIVSTPQDLALIDARKGLAMFARVDVPVLGIVENMSYFICPDCGARADIFGHGGAEAEAARLGVPFLGRIPLDMAIRESADNGVPIVVAEPDSEHAKAYMDIAGKILTRLGD